MPGGEQCVVELLENESRKLLNKPLLEEGGQGEKHSEEHRSLRNFFFRPYILGKELLTIEKFGLVQYVSYFSKFLFPFFLSFGIWI